MLSDIDEAEREIASRVERAVRYEFARVQDEVERAGVPALSRSSGRRQWRRVVVPVSACALTASIVAVAMVVLSRSDEGEHPRVDTVATVETTVPEEPRYFLPIGLDASYELQDVTGRYGAGLTPTPIPNVGRVRSYRDRDTERFVVIETRPGVSYQPVVGFPGTSVATVGGAQASVSASGSSSTWVTVGLACGFVNAVGRHLDATETLAALATLRCGDDGAVIDPPAGFALVLDQHHPSAEIADQTSLSYRAVRAGSGLRMLWISFSQSPVDANEHWLRSTSDSRVRDERRGDRLYHVFETEATATVNGVSNNVSNYWILFNEDGVGVSLSAMRASLDEALTLADSIRRVSAAEYQAALDRLEEEWRKDVYAVTDVVPEGFGVRPHEDIQRAGIGLSPPGGGSNYSLEFRSGPDFSASMPGREGRMVTVGDREIRLVGFDMAAPPANVGDPVTQFVALRQAIWSENGVTVTLTTSGGPEVEATLLAIIGGVRIVDEAEWKAFVARTNTN